MTLQGDRRGAYRLLLRQFVPRALERDGAPDLWGTGDDSLIEPCGCRVHLPLSQMPPRVIPIAFLQMLK